MESALNMTVNRLPARTWNWLKMNESRLSGIKIDGKHQIKAARTANGVAWYTAEDCVENSSENVAKDRIDAMEIWSKIETGMGPDMDRLADGGADVLAADSRSRDAELQNNEPEPAVLDFAYAPGEHSYNQIRLYAEPDSVLNVAVILRSTESGHNTQPNQGTPDGDQAENGLSAVQFKLYAERGAKIRLYMVQLLDEGVTCLSDIGGVCEQDASVELIKLELGAGKLYAGAMMDLKGDSSAFHAQIGYTGTKTQHLDMNYTARHRGKKTDSLMNVTGVLEDQAFKLFRGTIDFVSGCADSKGAENEDVLLLGEEVINQTIPLILCGEEHVEGAHGATIGRLDDKILFYLGSRGIPRDEAQRLIAQARIDALSSQIPSEEIRHRVQSFIGKETIDGTI